MGYLTVEGVYRDGVVTFDEPPAGLDGSERAIVIFVPRQGEMARRPGRRGRR